MRDRQKLKAYSKIAGAQRILLLAAAQTLALAQAEEDRRRGREDDARRSAEGALDDWVACVTAGLIDIDRLNGFAARLGDCEASLRSAEARHSQAIRKTVEHRQAYMMSDFRTEQSERIVERLRKAVARKNDSKELAATDDRTAYSWIKS